MVAKVRKALALGTWLTVSLLADRLQVTRNGKGPTISLNQQGSMAHSGMLSPLC